MPLVAGTKGRPKPKAKTEALDGGRASTGINSTESGGHLICYDSSLKLAMIFLSLAEH